MSANSFNAIYCFKTISQIVGISIQCLSIVQTKGQKHKTPAEKGRRRVQIYSVQQAQPKIYSTSFRKIRASAPIRCTKALRASQPHSLPNRIILEKLLKTIKSPDKEPACTGAVSPGRVSIFFFRRFVCQLLNNNNELSLRQSPAHRKYIARCHRPVSNLQALRHTHLTLSHAK